MASMTSGSAFAPRIPTISFFARLTPPLLALLVGLSSCGDGTLKVPIPGDAGGCDARVDGSCQASCVAPLVTCAGTCVDLTTSRTHCGACGTTCGAEQVCSNSLCADTCPATQVKCGGVCIDPALDLQYCGATTGCGTGTGSAGSTCVGGQLCAAGSCTCPTGFLFCNGVCVDPSQDRNLCGATACTNSGSVCGTNEICQGGVCTLSCPGDLVKCDGACINPRTDPDHCGATSNCEADGGTSGTACAAGQLCSGGVCAFSCQTGLINCGDVCIDPGTSRAYCGATLGCGNNGGSAGTSCGAGQVCNGGTCALTCQPGLINCGGACVDPGTSRAHCGAAGNCTSTGTGNSAGSTCNAGNLCVGGSCALSCPTGSVACAGVCINPATDNGYCGATGNCSNTGAGNSVGSTCSQGQVCNGGTCAVTCQPGLINCGGTCVDPRTSRTHCGATGDCTSTSAGNGTGATCGAGSLCVAGNCALSCPTGSVPCGGICINPATDNGHCGATGDCTNVGTGNSAGAMCASGGVCTGGTCALSCSIGLNACSGSCVDFSYSPNHCGACSNVCSSNNIAQPTCFGGSCNGSCATGYSDCDGNKLTNGCESDPMNDAANCGACSAGGDHDCNQNATGGTCSSGFCSGAACLAGHDDCDGLPDNGCERSVNTDAANCGACNTVCTNAHVADPATASCATGACTITACATGWDNCDSNNANGCEANTATDLNNCGACGTACGTNNVCIAGVCSTLSCGSASAVSSSTPGFASIGSHWPLDGTVGTIANNTAIPATIGTSGTAANANGAGMAYVAGQLSQALNLDGTDDYVDLGAIGNFGTADFSITLWLKTTPIGRTQWLVAKRNICSHANFYGIGIASNGRLIFEIDQDSSGTNYGPLIGGTSVTDNLWHHVAFVRQGTSMKIYLDGNVDGSFTTTGVTNLSNNTNLILGRIPCAGSQNFRGLLDDVAIWTGYGLSLSEERLIACDGGN